VSLVALASRIILIEAIRDKTWAGDYVRNAPLDPVPGLLRDATGTPLITVYTGIIKSKPDGRNLIGSEMQDRIEVVLQIYLPGSDLDDDGADLNIGRAGAAFAVDVIWRQIVAALQRDIDNPWSRLWARLIVCYEDFDSRPVLIEVENGVRIPCREISLMCRTLPEPAFGVALNSFWADLDTVLRAGIGEDPTLEQQERLMAADTLRSLITEPGDLPSWRQAAAVMGWSIGAARASGLAPFDTTEDGEAGELGGITIDPADLAVTDGF